MSSISRDLSSDTPDIETGMPSKPFITDVLADNPFRAEMPSQAMHRTGFGKAGKPAKIQINSHAVQSWPQRPVYQYDVSHRCTDSLPTFTNHKFTDLDWIWCREAWSHQSCLDV